MAARGYPPHPFAEPANPDDGPHPVAPIARASSEIRRFVEAAQRAAVRRAQARRRVAAIDELLAVLEARHLLRQRTMDRLLRARVRRLEQEVGLPLPRKVVRARNTVRLHAALLDWQEEVLDHVAPWRRRFPDVAADDDLGDGEDEPGAESA